MKQVLKLTLAAVLMMGSCSVFAQKFGRVNTQEIIVAMPETKEMQTKMEAIVKDYRDNLEAITVELNNKFQDFQKNYETYSDAVRDMKQKDLQSLEARRAEFEQVAQQETQKKQNEMLAPIIEKAKTAIDKVSKEGGYFVVFDTSVGSLIYFDEANLTDLAPAVKKELGIVETATPAAPAAKK